MIAKPERKTKQSTVVKKAQSAKSGGKHQKTKKFADIGLDPELIDKAVKAVLKYHDKIRNGSSDKLTLLGDDRPFQVQFTLLNAPGKSQPKPYQIQIPHPFYKLAATNDSNNNGDSDDDFQEEPEICLIVKESSKLWCQEMIEKFPDHMGCVKKVLGLDSLRKKHASFEQKRQLLSKYNMFMADDRILPMMSKALGKAFIKAKRLPVPINLTREIALPLAVQKALSATYMTVNTGTCISIRTGHTGMEPEKISANIMAIVKSAVTKIPRSWANVQMISIKTADSVSLPVYNKTPEALKEIAKLAGITGVSNKEQTSNNDETEINQHQMREAQKEDNLKSPLLQALKKQKRMEEEKMTTTKKKRPNSVNSNGNNVVDKKTSKDKVALKEKVNTNDSDKKISKRSASPQPTSSPGTKKKQRHDGKKSEETKQEIVEARKEFIATKKFKGSKKGYVFLMGAKGLGYYVDVKPVVDKMKIEALMRMNQNRGGGGSNRRGKSKNNSGGRKGRRSY